MTHITPPTPLASSSANRIASNVGGNSLPHSSLALVDTTASESPESRFRSISGSPGLKPSDPFMDLLFSGWDPDLPDPNTLNH